MADQPDQAWRPTATLDSLQHRAQILARIRAYFQAQAVLEVETPLLSSATIPDPNIPSFGVPAGQPGEAGRYLSTSPEFAMKRLLAAGSGAIYQICKAFRQGESGGRHNPEFTLVEWYRPGFDDRRLMQEVADLVCQVSEGYRSWTPATYITYVEAFRQQLGIDHNRVETADLPSLAAAQGIGEVVGLAKDDRDGWLDLLFSHCVQPTLGRQGPCFVHEYPASQAALARLKPDNPGVAARFELFIQGVEIANGFHELGNAAEQRQRFEREQVRRRQRGLEPVSLDEHLLAALAQGLPDCAGVALGLDRLLMVLLQKAVIGEVMAFTFDRS